MDDTVRKISFSLQCEKALAKCKKSKPVIFEEVKVKIEKVVRAPYLGKPLRYSMKNRRRVHLGSFVLVYEFYNGELRFLDFDHHDKVYKK